MIEILMFASSKSNVKYFEYYSSVYKFFIEQKKYFYREKEILFIYYSFDVDKLIKSRWIFCCCQGWVSL